MHKWKFLNTTYMCSPEVKDSIVKEYSVTWVCENCKCTYTTELRLTGPYEQDKLVPPSKHILISRHKVNKKNPPNEDLSCSEAIVYNVNVE